MKYGIVKHEGLETAQLLSSHRRINWFYGCRAKKYCVTSPTRARTINELSSIDKFSAAFINILFYWKITPRRMLITIPRAPSLSLLRPINHQLIFNWLHTETDFKTCTMRKVSHPSVKWSRLSKSPLDDEVYKRISALQSIESEDRFISKCFPCLESLKLPSRHSIIGELRSKK